MITKSFADDMFTLMGLSTDEKPIIEKDDPNYDKHTVAFYEIDTTDLYFYDYDNREWIKQ